MSENSNGLPKPPPLPPKPKLPTPPNSDTVKPAQGLPTANPQPAAPKPSGAPTGLPKPATTQEPVTPKQTLPAGTQQPQTPSQQPTAPTQGDTGVPPAFPTVNTTQSEPTASKTLPTGTGKATETRIQAATPTTPQNSALTQTTLPPKNTTPTMNPANFIIDDDEDDFTSLANSPSSSKQNPVSTFQTSEPETNTKPELLLPQGSEYSIQDETEELKAEIIDDNNANYYEETETDYYGNNEIVVSRNNIFGRIVQPLGWTALALGIITGGVLITPFIADWFNTNFTPETVTVEVETDTAPLVEGEALIVPTDPAAEQEEYNPQITKPTAGAVENNGILPETSSGTVPYTNQPDRGQPSLIDIQLDSIEKTDNFAPTLREFRTASVGEAVAQGMTQEEIETQTPNYRMSFVKITMQYEGEPQTFPVNQIHPPFTLGNQETAIGLDASQNVLAYYVNNLGYSIEDGQAEILKDHNCDISQEIPETFWEGETIQKCFIIVSNKEFSSIEYDSGDYTATLQSTYVE